MSSSDSSRCDMLWKTVPDLNFYHECVFVFLHLFHFVFFSISSALAIFLSRLALMFYDCLLNYLHTYLVNTCIANRHVVCFHEMYCIVDAPDPIDQHDTYPDYNYSPDYEPAGHGHKPPGKYDYGKPGDYEYKPPGKYDYGKPGDYDYHKPGKYTYKPDKPAYGYGYGYGYEPPRMCKAKNICKRKGYKCCACAECNSESFGCAETCACCPRVSNEHRIRNSFKLKCRLVSTFLLSTRQPFSRFMPSPPQKKNSMWPRFWW